MAQQSLQEFEWIIVFDAAAFAEYDAAAETLRSHNITVPSLIHFDGLACFCFFLSQALSSSSPLHLLLFCNLSTELVAQQWRLLQDDDPRRSVVQLREMGVRLARAPYVFFLANDDLLEPTALEKLWWFLEANPVRTFLLKMRIAALALMRIRAGAPVRVAADGALRDGDEPAARRLPPARAPPR